MLYLLKLYNGKDFGTQAGAYWRMLFVLALMPWMRNYRVHLDQQVQPEDDEDAISIRQQLVNEMDGWATRGQGNDFVAIQLDQVRWSSFNRRGHNIGTVSVARVIVGSNLKVWPLITKTRN